MCCCTQRMRMCSLCYRISSSILFGGGIGLRQICDWCRLLWTYKESIDAFLLETRLRKAGMLTEWKAFVALALEWLGMPVEEMPLLDVSCKWSRNAARIMAFILETGNFGHNRDNSFRQKSFLVRSAVSTWRYTCDTLRHLFVFPLDSLKAWGRMVWNGVRGGGRDG